MELEEKVFGLAVLLADPLGLEIKEVIWEKEKQNYYLRIIADAEEGLSVEDATALNEALSLALDEKNWIDQEYFLEVSSPGIEREIKTEQDWNKAQDQYVFVQLEEIIEKQKEWYGFLRSVKNDEIILEINIKGRKKNIGIARNQIKWIRFAVHF